MNEKYSENTPAEISRKRFLQRIGATGAGAMLGGAMTNRATAAPHAHTAQTNVPGGDASTRGHETRLAQLEARVAANENAGVLLHGPREHEFNVRGFGAKGDGKTDDTTAFQTAIGALAERGGGTLYIPPGRYLIATHLEIAENVTLRGVFESSSLFAGRPEDNANWGSVLLAVEGAGNADGTPFLTMHNSSALVGIIVFYPEQKRPIPVPYPWTVRGAGSNISLIDCTLVNPYQALDFGTNGGGRHYLFNLNAHALYRGLWVDQCYDIGRVQNVHFWPFWYDDANIHAWVRENAIAFTFGRTDWEYVLNCFCIFYKIGYHFRAFDNGGGNVLLLNSGSDVGPLAVQVDALEAHAGVSFVNGQFMARVNVSESNDGPVKFTNCAFYGSGKTDSHLVSQSRARVSFDNCHFSSWDQNGSGAPAIRAESGTLGISNCEFFNGGANHIALGSDLRAANIIGNHFRGIQRIENKSRGQVQIVGNTDEKPLPPRALQRRFFSGFEANQPAPILDALEIGVTGETSLRVGSDGRDGGRALLLSAAKTTREGGHGSQYFRVFAVNIPVRPDTIFRYWMRVGNEAARRSGFDLVLDGAKAGDEGKSLRHAVGATSVAGVAMHPAEPKGLVGQWVRVESPIGKWLAGHTITGIIAAWDGSSSDAFQVAFDDVEIGEPLK